MNIADILKNYEYYHLQIRSGTAAEHIVDMMCKLNEIFSDQLLISYECSGIKIIELYYKQKLTCEQIAEQLHISTKTVYRRKRAALNLLSKIFDNV